MRTRMTLAVTLCGLISVACGPRMEEIVEDILEDLDQGHEPPEDPGPGPDNGPYQVLENGYVLSGSWAGYAWIAAQGATVAPTDFVGHPAGEPLCMSGIVAAAPDYGGIAGLGINLNQPVDSDISEGWEVTSEGVRYQISNPMGVELRLHLLGASGGDWCVWLSGESGTLAWSDFRTECWSDEGMVYDGDEPLDSIMVMVPGLAASDVPFDVCVENLEPTNEVTGGPTPPEVCADSVGAGAGELAPGFGVAPGGYVTGQEIQGWAYVASNSSTDEGSVTPTDFSAHPGGAPLCISGTVGASPDYLDFALLGVNLHQGFEPEAEAGVVSLSGLGLTYDISNCGETPLRLELLGEHGASDTEERWCVDVAGGQGFVLWSDFNTTCWDGLGTPYDGVTPLSAANILVPPRAEGSVFFDFCLNGLT